MDELCIVSSSTRWHPVTAWVRFLPNSSKASTIETGHGFFFWVPVVAMRHGKISAKWRWSQKTGWNIERERGRERNIPKHQPVITSNPMPSLHMRHLAKTAQNFWAGCLFEWFTGSTIMVLSTSQPRHDQRKSHPPLHLPFPDRYRTPTLVALFFTKPVVSSALRQWIAIFYHFPSEKSSQTENIATLVQVSPVFSASSSILWISALISWGFKTVPTWQKRLSSTTFRLAGKCILA